VVQDVDEGDGMEFGNPEAIYAAGPTTSDRQERDAFSQQ